MNLDPQIAPLIEALDAGFPPVHTMTGAQARATIRSRFVPPAEPEPVAEVRDDDRPGPGGDIPVRIYRPDGGRPADPGVRPRRRFRVLRSRQPRRAVPRHRQPHSRRCDFGRLPAWRRRIPGPRGRRFYAAAQWAADNADALGGDAGRVVVGGDSAGGNLAAVTALMARDRGGPPIAAQLLIYPVIAADFDNESYRLFGKGFYNPKPALQWYWDQYVPSPADREHPYASPLRANLAGLPPADRRHRRP